jgi:hypothetical protein
MDHGVSWATVGNSFPSQIFGPNTIAVTYPYIWIGSNNLVICSPNGGTTWISLSLSTGGGVMMDSVTPSIAWTGGTSVYKLTYSGGSITAQSLPNGALGNGIRSLWINPSNSSHQRAFSSDVILRETFDQWSSYEEYLLPAYGFAVDEVICQQRWSIDYNWGAVLKAYNAFAIFTAPTISGSYAFDNGANPLTPPYTNSVPLSLTTSPTFGFWAGKAT